MSETLDVGTLLAHIGVDTSGLKRANKAVDGFTDNAEKDMKKVTKATNTLGRAFTALVSAAVFTQITRASWDLVQSASDLEEATGKFETVFRDVANTTNWVKDLQADFAMSETEAKKYLGNIQDLLVPMGLNRKAAAGLSKEIVKLAADLGSFNNFSTQKVMEDIQSGLVGNYETMKKYGVMLTATTVEQKALNMGLVDHKRDLSYAHKALAAYTIMVDGSGDAIGDLARTSMSFANVLKDTKAKWEDLRNEIGNEFLPVARDTLVTARDLVAYFRKNKEEIVSLVKWTGALIKIVAVGGGLYALPKLFQLTKTAIMAANAQLVIFNGNLSMTAKAAASLFALFAGWQIGKQLSDQFETARLAGVALVDGTLKGFYYLEHGVKVVWAAIETSWKGTIRKMKEELSDFLDMVSTSLSHVPLMDKVSEKVRFDADELRSSIKEGEETFREAQIRLKEELKETMSVHNSLVDELISAASDENYHKKVTITGDPNIEKRMKESSSVVDDVLSSFDSAPDSDTAIRKRKEMEIELNAKLKELTMERLDFFDWETNQRLGKLAASYGKESGIYKTTGEIRLKERINLQKSLAQIVDGEHKERIRIMDSLKLREIAAIKGPFDARRYTLQQEKKMFEDKYEGDEEVIKRFTEVYIAEMAKIDESYKKYMKDQLKETSTWSDEMGEMFSGWGNTFVDTLNDMLWESKVSFSEIGREFAKMVTKMAIQKGISTLMSSFGGGGGGAAAAGTSTAVGHAGGVVGSGFGRVKKMVSPSIFAEAPRLHKGLSNNEFPAILEKGETVIPKNTLIMGEQKDQKEEVPINEVHIANIVDPQLIGAYLASSNGKKAIKNALSFNKGFIQSLVSV